MSIQALYPSRRYPQRNNPLLRREQRRRRLIAVAALMSCLIGMAMFRISPNEASAAARLESMTPAAPVALASTRHIRVIPLYHIPSEQAGGAQADQD
jgi:hypothetical protein